MKEVRYTGSKPLKSRLDKLTNQQLTFLKANHQLIEVGVVVAKFRDDWTILEKLITMEQYQSLFGEYGWDVVYESYQSSPGYDMSLSLKLQNQLQLVNRYTGDESG